MKDTLQFKGHFKIEALDKDNNVVDQWQEDNLIMESARLTMAEIFTLASTNAGINKIVLGSKGYNGDVRIPKTSTEGFVDTRDRLFSETIDVADGETNTYLRGDIIKYTGNANATGTQNNYYERTGGTTTVATSSINFATGWTDLGTEAPYTYTVTFDLPGTSSGNALNIVEDDGIVGSTVSIDQNDNDVQFVFSISTLAANGADDPQPGSTTFTEAALYANDRVFSMKTFGSKIKDTTVLLKITWTISF